MLAPDCNYSNFKHIETTNGADIMKLARELERKTTALARYKKHLTFNHTLKGENILPPGLNFTRLSEVKQATKSLEIQA